MKVLIFHYGKIALMLFLGGVAYLGVGQLTKPHAAAQPIALTLSYLATLVVAPAVLALAVPNHRTARWAGISHCRFLTLSRRQKAVLVWGRKKQRLGRAPNSAEYPPVSTDELENLLATLAENARVD